MAIAKDGILGGFSGKVGNIVVTYLKWGLLLCELLPKLLKTTHRKTTLAETEVFSSDRVYQAFSRNYPTVL